MQTGFSIRGVNNVPYRLVRSVYTVPTSKPVRLTPPISYQKKYWPYRSCTGRTGQFWAISAGTGRTGRYRKKFIIIFFLKFCNF